jgi:hypothetical protein
MHEAKLAERKEYDIVRLAVFLIQGLIFSVVNAKQNLLFLTKKSIDFFYDESKFFNIGGISMSGNITIKISSKIYKPLSVRVCGLVEVFCFQKQD